MLSQQLLLGLQRIERGEIIESGYDGFFRVRADGKDEISSLPRHVALRVSRLNHNGRVDFFVRECLVKHLKIGNSCGRKVA